MVELRIARLRGNPPAKAVLTDIRSKCNRLPELEKLCLGVVDRLEALHDEVAQYRTDDTLRVKYIDIILILVKRIVRRKPLLTRLATFHSAALVIRRLHQDLDDVETVLRAGSEGQEWGDQWESDRTEQFSILENLVQNATDRHLVREIKSHKMVQQVLMKLHKELGGCPFETHCQLMRATFDRVCAFARLDDVQFPDWYISADDLMFEDGSGVSGAFGEVRHAMWFHAGERTRVMVKQLFQNSSVETDQDTFEQCQLWEKLSDSDHILKFHGGSHASKPQYYVCEYARYGNLRDYLTDEKLETEMWPLFLQAAEGLKTLHSHGIVHGALKCSNILVDASRTAKIADFGFTSARMYAVDLNSDAAAASTSAVRWKPKDLLEYSDSTGPQFKADSYSLGMCMIEALTHQAPFGMVDDTEVVEMILRGESHPRPDGVSDAVWDL
ncbi:serine/threonine protein kinase, partial [Phytophthora nicotianae]